MKILFLHGKESSPETSSSASAVKEYFKDYEVLVPDYMPRTSTHAEIEAFLKSYYAENVKEDDCSLIGISLGGYWALNMTNFTPATTVIMLNPSLRYYGEPPVVSADVGGHMILNMDDDVVDNEWNLKTYNARFKIDTFPSGGHRMTNMSEVLPLIEDTIELLAVWGP